MNQLGLPITLDSKMLLENLLGNQQILDFINQLYSQERSAEIYVYGETGKGKNISCKALYQGRLQKKRTVCI